MRFSYAIPMLLAFVAAEDEITWVDGAEGTNAKVQWRQAVEDGRWFLWIKTTTKHTKWDTIAKWPKKLKTMFWITDQMTLEGAPLEDWAKEEKGTKMREFSDKMAKEGTSMCVGNLKYFGFKDSTVGHTNRELSVEGGCQEGDAGMGLQGFDLEGATISEDGKSVVVGISKDMMIAPRWEEDGEYIFAVNIIGAGETETADVDYDYFSVPTKILLGGMSLAAAGAATLATLLTF